jgi:hypothetical protein
MKPLDDLPPAARTALIRLRRLDADPDVVDAVIDCVLSLFMPLVTEALAQAIAWKAGKAGQRPRKPGP